MKVINNFNDDPLTEKEIERLTNSHEEIVKKMNTFYFILGMALIPLGSIMFFLIFKETNKDAVIFTFENLALNIILSILFGGLLSALITNYRYIRQSKDIGLMVEGKPISAMHFDSQLQDINDKDCLEIKKICNQSFEFREFVAKRNNMGRKLVNFELEMLRSHSRVLDVKLACSEISAYGMSNKEASKS